MVTSGKRIGMGITAALLLMSVSTAVHGQVPGGSGVGSFGGELRGVTQFEGKVVCVGCTLEEVQKAHPDQHDLCQLNHRTGQVVMEVKEVNDPQLWSYFAWPPRIWVRSDDRLFAKLTAEKNLFKEVKVTGLLRSTRTLDMFSVTLNG